MESLTLMREWQGKLWWLLILLVLLDIWWQPVLPWTASLMTLLKPWQRSKERHPQQCLHPPHPQLVEPSQTLDQDTPWLPSMLLRINGTSSAISRQRLLDSPWPRLLHVLLSLTISTAVSTLEIGIPIETLLLFLTPSSKSTMVFLQMQDIHQT